MQSTIDVTDRNNFNNFYIIYIVNREQVFYPKRSMSPPQNLTPNQLSPNIQPYATINNNYSHNQNFKRNNSQNMTQFNYNPINNNMQRSPTQFLDKTRGPYGVRFEDMDLHKKGEQRQYKDDLEYLMSLKNSRHGDMTQKEWEAYNRKLHYMNDRYAYGELDRINF